LRPLGYDLSTNIHILWNKSVGFEYSDLR
jgi:hypothetical protein